MYDLTNTMIHVKKYSRLITAKIDNALDGATGHFLV